MFRIEHNVETGEIKKIDLSQEEIDELSLIMKAKAIENEIKFAELEKIELEIAAAKSRILSKLGISVDEAKLLLS